MDLIGLFGNDVCSCGRCHTFSAQVLTGAGVLAQLPERLQALGVQRPFLLADRNTWAAAGQQVQQILCDAGLQPAAFVFPQETVEPDEAAVGLAVMHFDRGCDGVIGIGGGVINDIGKILAATASLPYVIVGTAPSMDGFASATSSMTRAGLKISLPSKCADLIVGDLDVLCRAPMRLMLAGLGDMLAKYVSIAEWRISHLINGEYYCERIAALTRDALRCCIDHADGLLQRQPQAVAAVFEGLVLCGAAMKYAGISRPASGVEHYFSHIWDMRGVAFGTPVQLHGLQCAVATRIAIRAYALLADCKPDRDRALTAVRQFRYADWTETLRGFVGPGAEAMIALEAKEGKYDPAKHAARLEVILAHWENICAILREELPAPAWLDALMARLGLPCTMADLSLADTSFALTFGASRDIRDKYVLSRLVWDLGLTEQLTEQLENSV